MTEQELKLKISIAKAMQNSSKQKYRISKGKLVIVRPQFWEQVANDYRQELNDLKNK